MVSRTILCHFYSYCNWGMYESTFMKRHFGRINQI